MYRFICFFAILFFQSCQQAPPNAFEVQVRHLFFDEQIEKPSQSLIEQYQKHTLLTYLAPASGWTSYPKLSALGELGPLRFHTFVFSKHPFLNFSFKKGELIIISSWETDKIESPILKITFSSYSNRIAAYDSLLSPLTKLEFVKKSEPIDDLGTIAIFRNSKVSAVDQLTIQMKESISQEGDYQLYIALDRDNIRKVELIELIPK
jgi:hypothetical protein